MHVLEFLHVLGRAPHIEIIKAQLPEPRPVMPNRPRTALFQHLHRQRRRAEFGFIDQKVNVLRHDHITDDDKAIPAPITTEGDEVEVSLTVVTLETAMHRENDTNYDL